MEILPNGLSRQIRQVIRERGLDLSLYQEVTVLFSGPHFREPCAKATYRRRFMGSRL
jgi:hypothetical protein